MSLHSGRAKYSLKARKLSAKIITANKYLSVRFSSHLLHLFSFVVFPSRRRSTKENAQRR